MTKQFKIGEYAIGGIIKVNSDKQNIKISALDWTSKNELISNTFKINDEYGIDDFLHELTSSYYADKIINYIKNNK